MSLLSKLKAGTRNVKTIMFPGTEEIVAIRILSNGEIQDSVFATEAFFKAKEMEVSNTTYDAYADERTTQILFRALRDPGDYSKSFAAKVEELRNCLEKAEKDLLVAEYNAFEQECSPQIKKMTDKEFESLWEDLKKNPEILLNSLSSGIQKRLIIYLASLPQK